MPADSPSFKSPRRLVNSVALLLTVLFLTACGGKDPVEVAATARPVKMITISAADNGAPVEFPAVIRARNSVELAFNVPGQVTELPVIEGERVAEGSLLAALDNTEYKARLQAAEAAMELAQTDFDRISELSRSGAVAIAEVDQKRAALQAASSELDLARKAFEDTVLKAPFQGVVSRRLIQRFTNVQAKQPVLVFQSLQPLDVIIDVPEPMVIRSVYDKNQPPPTRVRFDSLPGVTLPIEFREVSTEADPQTQTFKATFSLEDTGDITVLPGMSAVLVAERVATGGASVYLLPPLAVTIDPDGGRQVWVYDPATGEVSPRTVEIGRLRDDGLEVVSGLSEGDQVVVAGISQLTTGMKVRPQNP